jgi:hypothetical protein
MLVESNISDKSNIIEYLSNVFEIVNKVQIVESDGVLLDFSNVSTKAPAYTLPLSVFLSGSGKNIQYRLSKDLKDVSFCDGINSSEIRLSAFRAMMQAYTITDYLPIVAIPTSRLEDDLKDNIQSIIEDVLIEQIGNINNVASGLRYIIGECVDNITQHAKSDFGYISAVTNKVKRFIDICIADRGITLLGSYKENNDADIHTDMEALKAANRGISTKNLPDAENRGFGIVTSKKMLTDGLGGMFIMISGSAMLMKTEHLNEYVEIPEGLYCKGTVVICRIYFDNKDFNYIKYVE